MYLLHVARTLHSFRLGLITDSQATLRSDLSVEVRESRRSLRNRLARLASKAAVSELDIKRA